MADRWGGGGGGILRYTGKTIMIPRLEIEREPPVYTSIMPKIEKDQYEIII